MIITLLEIVILMCSTSFIQSLSVFSENKQSGHPEWWHPADQESPSAPSGFTTRFSYDPGQLIEFKVNSTNSEFNCSIYRLGFYGGSGGRRLTTVVVRGQRPQPACLFFPVSKLTDCSNWNVSFSWFVPEDTTSGVFIAVLSSYETPQDVEHSKVLTGFYIPFVIRKRITDASIHYGSDILFKTSDLTWVAYNKFGGWNLYRGNGSFTFDSRATMASYNRPFTNRLPKFQGGQHQNFLFGSEFPLIFWLEKQGYDVSYCSCADIEDYANRNMLIDRYKVLLSVGHDEYWSSAMRSAYVLGRDRGINLAFFSGNEMFWRIRWMNASRGESSLLKTSAIDDYRVVICYKETLDNTALSNKKDEYTGTFVDPRFFPDDSMHKLTGQYFEVNGYRNDVMTISAEDAQMRFWRNCFSLHDFKQFEIFSFPRGYLGYEWDAFHDGDCDLPRGIIPLSTTHVNVDGFRMENYGQSYKGNGELTHRMTMYRHINTLHSRNNQINAAKHVEEELVGHRQQQTQHRKTFDLTNKERRNLLSKVKLPSSGTQSKNNHNNTQYGLLSNVKRHHRTGRISSLVFGAGTVQWTWGLSAWHDADEHVPAHCAVQQATYNLFADMHTFPTPATMQRENESFFVSAGNGHEASSPMCQLKVTVASTDITPPSSSITFPLHFGIMHAAYSTVSLSWYINITGTAVDVDRDGKIASVEVSVDGGLSWNIASGKANWYFVYHFDGLGKICSNNNANAHDTLGTVANGHLNAADASYRSANQSLESSRDSYDNALELLHIVSRAVDDSGWLEPCHSHRFPNQPATASNSNHQHCGVPSRVEKWSNNIMTAVILRGLKIRI